MNKGQLVDILASKSGATKVETARFLDLFVDTIGSALSDGEEVRLVGFGTFKVMKFAARKVRNPQNGKEMSLSAGSRPRFVAGKKLKEIVSKD